MRRFKAVVLTILLLFTISSCNSGGESSHSHSDSKEKVIYTCSMHPEIRESEPGNCPICHMKLTKLVLTEGDSQENKIDKKNEHSGHEDHADHDNANDKTYYTCSMHPEIREDKPGKCPICHMNLTKVSVAEEDLSQEKMDMSHVDLAKINLRKAQLNHFKPSYFKVQKKKMERKIRILGSVL
ncbi:MAG: heavy metal-binding domain-containing protein [Bdellovibrionota bacterium]|nr:heavy metal-binding domain-containing protein [Bdellovibrionota bacterium]